MIHCHINECLECHEFSGWKGLNEDGWQYVEEDGEFFCSNHNSPVDEKRDTGSG